jgi:hypothetical protein
MKKSQKFTGRLFIVVGCIDGNCGVFNFHFFGQMPMLILNINLDILAGKNINNEIKNG